MIFPHDYATSPRMGIVLVRDSGTLFGDSVLECHQSGTVARHQVAMFPEHNFAYISAMISAPQLTQALVPK